MQELLSRDRHRELLWNIECLPKQNIAKMEKIINAALDAADPAKAVESYIHYHQPMLEVGDKSYNLDQYKHIYLIGFGKAVIQMTKGLINVLGNRITKGAIITKYMPYDGIKSLPAQIMVLIGNHPIPGLESLKSTKKLVSIIDHCKEDDLVICLISGGGSALLTMPYDGITLEVIQQMTEKLLVRGADIREINIVRKWTDRVKGGGLADLIFPGKIISLILSDVVGNPLDIIASGPTVLWNMDNFKEAEMIMRQYGINEDCMMRIATTKRNTSLARVQNEIVSSNYHAARKAIEEAERLQFYSLLLTTYLQGEAAVSGKFLASVLKQMAISGDPVKRPGCVVIGGETTVVLGQLNSYMSNDSATGMKPTGGRNLELALGSVKEIEDLNQVALVSLATDGEDGPTDAAGAIVTGETLLRAKEMGLEPADYLQKHDSYNFFRPLNALIKTGPTGTNVNDLNLLFTF